MLPHYYKAIIEWTGNLGSGTINYQAYSRDYLVKMDGDKIIKGSSDPVFRGDPNRFNPEELLLASLSACHMLWYLHLCAENNIVVTAYTDEAKATMVMHANGSGNISEVILNPHVKIANSAMAEQAKHLHKQANKMCFIANSVNFTVSHHVVIS